MELARDYAPTERERLRAVQLSQCLRVEAVQKRLARFPAKATVLVWTIPPEGTLLDSELEALCSVRAVGGPLLCHCAGQCVCGAGEGHVRGETSLPPPAAR